MKKKVVALGLAVLLITSIFFMNNTKVSASKLDKGAVSYATSTSTVSLSDGFYSASASLTPSPFTVDIGVEPVTIQKVVIEDANGVEITPLTLSSGSIYNLPSLTGQAISVSAGNLQSYNGYFRWLRNAQSNVWSYDSDDGVTHHSTEAGSPNDSYGYYTIPSQSYVWRDSHVISHPNGFSVSVGTVPFDAVTNVTLTNAAFVRGSEPAPKLQLESGNNPSFVNGYDAKIAFTETFDYAITDPKYSGAYADPTAIWYQYNNGVQVDYEATTYYYPSNWRIVAYINTPTPTPASITGDFTINPSSTIPWRDSFTLHPLPFTLSAGCTYQDHYYKIERNGSSVTTPKVYSATQDTSYSYGSYPSVIAVGSHNISLMIEATCGNSGWISTHTLNVTGPSSNNPPDFILGWVYPGTKTPVTQVVQGTKLDLIYIDDPSVPTPKDPDGDPIYFDGFNFSSSDAWTQTIPTKSGVGLYTDGYHNITMDGLGNHSASGSFHDVFGASATKSTSVYVVPPNPVPVCTAPGAVKENRPIAAGAINADSSYSPLNRAIDHTKDVWINKLSSYVNGTSSDITVQAILQKITDSAGLDSLNPSTCNIIVHPDLPPIGKLAVPPLGLRGQSYDIYNQSTSPDGDTIVSIQYKYKYDANNNGFGDDSWTSISGDLTKVVFAPTKVGKYLFYADVCEDYGKCGNTISQGDSTLTLDITNLAPTVSFSISGQNNQPQANPPTIYSSSTILSSWSLYKTNSTTSLNPALFWSNANGALAGGVGKRNETQDYSFISYTRGGYDYSHNWFDPFQNNGLMSPNLSPYRSIKTNDSTKSQPVLIQLPEVNSGAPFPLSYGLDGNNNTQASATIRTNKTHIFFNYFNYGAMSYGSTFGQYYFAMNKSKIGRYQGNTVCNGCYFPSFEHKYLDGSPYDFILSPKNLYALRPAFISYQYWDYTAYRAKNTARANPPVNTKFNAVEVTGYEISNNTIYQKVHWKCYNCTSYNDGSGNIQSVDTDTIDIRTYDIQTGALIASSMANNTDLSSMNAWLKMNSYSVGDNLIMYEGTSIYELNRLGQLVKQANTVPAGYGKTQSNINYSCNYYLANQTRRLGANGEFYQLETANCQGYNSSGGYSTFNDGFYVSRMNPDYTTAWRVKLYKTAGFENSIQYGLGDPTESKGAFFINPATNSIVVRSYEVVGYGLNTFYTSVDMTTGATTPFNSAFTFGLMSSSFEIDANGGMQSRNPTASVYTVDGYKTYNDHVVKNSANTSVASFPAGGGILNISGPYAEVTQYPKYTTYVGDGIALTMFDGMYGGYSTGKYTPWLQVGTPSTAPVVYQGFDNGQFVSATTQSDNEFSFDMKMRNAHVDKDFAGFSFRIQDPKNRYALETEGDKIYLSKYINGTRTILNSIVFPFVDGVNYTFSIKSAGTHIDISVGGVPYFSADDSTYSSGKFGPFATKSNVTFGSISSKLVIPPKLEMISGFAIWENGSSSGTVQYDNLVFTDPENDPSSYYDWSYSHVPKFINNQGISSLVGQTFSTGQLQFDNVGEYMVSMRAKDDPFPNIAFQYPSLVFDAYRKLSNTFQSKVIVHRRPIAEFSLAADASGVIVWTDTSYDPDRYDKATGTFSTENTGINYQATRGVLDWKYYYITPSGTTVNSKLTRPQEIGSYLVGMQVQDEYGAWSNAATQSYGTAILAPTNQPPVAAVTNPNGALALPTVFNTLRPTITWSQTDPDAGATFKQYQIQVLNETNTFMYVDSGIQSQNTASTTANWTVNVDLPATEKLRVKVRVSDGLDWSNWSSPTWMIINSAPTATMTVPGGTETVPTIFSSLRPTLQWSQTDIDSGTVFKAFQIQITNEANNVMLLDSGQIAQNTTSATGSWTVTSDLPAGQKLRVWVRVYDGYVWSSYSPQTWMYMNRAPTADFDWSPKPIFEGDTASFVNLSTDPDGDALTYSWTVRRPDHSRFGIVQNQFSQLLSMAGNYEVTLDVSDGKATASVTKTFTVLPLTIQSDVTYTQQWLGHHQNSGHQTTQRPRDFYSGEIFIVETRSASAPVAEAKAWIDTTGLAGNDIMISEILESTSDPNLFQGELFDPVLQSMTDGIPEGLQTIHFEIRYTNGIVKTENIPVNIIGNVNHSFGVHRVR